MCVLKGATAGIMMQNDGHILVISTEHDKSYLLTVFFLFPNVAKLLSVMTHLSLPDELVEMICVAKSLTVKTAICNNEVSQRSTDVLLLL